jgi:epoxyqueuosine reductase
MKEAIRRRARELGFDECRFTSAAPPDSAVHLHKWLGSQHHGEMAYLERNAQKRVDPQKVLPGAKTIITLAASYAQTEDEPSHLPHSALHTPCSGVVARYARYQDYHNVLGLRLKKLTDLLREIGGPGGCSLWYVDTGPLLERDLAQRSGLGFIGKHTNLISRRLGNWIFLSEIITTLVLEPDEPEKNRCGSCTRCITACPTSAITAPFQLDARRCISYLTIELKGPIPRELRPAIGNRIYGCDDCLAVCPWNRFAKAGSLMRAHERPELATPDLLELLSLDETEFKRRFAGTPMVRTKRRGLLRNACVALGNVADQHALPALEKASSDPDPLIAEHALWAIGQIQHRAATKSAG